MKFSEIFQKFVAVLNDFDEYYLLFKNMILSKRFILVGKVSSFFLAKIRPQNSLKGQLKILLIIFQLNF